jgi:hypothetical protein
MEPLNKQERTEAFIKMLALFLVAMAAVALVMFMTIELPSKELDKCKSERDNLTSQMEVMVNSDHQFLLKADTAWTIYQKYDQENNEMARTKLRAQDSFISNDMERLSGALQNDTLKSRVYANLVFSFDKLFTSKNEILDLRDQLAKVIDKKDPDGPKPDLRTMKEKEIEILREVLNNNKRNIKNAAKEIDMPEKLFKEVLKNYHL